MQRRGVKMEKRKVKAIVWCDIHLLGGHSLYKGQELSATELMAKDERDYPGLVYGLGDLVDLGGCLKKDVGLAEALIWNLRCLLGRRYLQGNHELTESKLNESLVHQGILFKHTHEEWESIYTMDRVPGVSRFRNSLLVPFYQWFRTKWQKPTTPQFLRNAVESMDKAGVKELWGGHRHPKELASVAVIRQDKVYRVKVFPRGRTVIYE